MVTAGAQRVYRKDAVLPTVEPPEEKPALPQIEFVKQINDDRGKLYEGFASAKLFKTAQVDQPFPLDLTVCGSAALTCKVSEVAPTAVAGAAAADKPEAAPAPRGANKPLGEVFVGGRVKAELYTFQQGVDIQATGDDTVTITDPEDVGEWRWTVKPTDAGVLDLQISVTTLRADSDTALFPTRYFDVAIRVNETKGHRIRSVLNSTWTQVGGLAGLAAILAVLVSFLVHRNSRRKVAPAMATPAPASPPPVVPAPTPAASTPKSPRMGSPGSKGAGKPLLQRPGAGKRAKGDRRSPGRP